MRNINLTSFLKYTFFICVCLFSNFNVFSQQKSDKVSADVADLAAYGLLDVTASPYFADSTGKIDCTEVLQQAIIDARTTKKACFFPSGHYLISNTLSCEIPVYKLPIVGGQQGKLEDACGKYMDGDSKTQHYWQNTSDKIVLIGSNKNGRPVIHLKQGADGFQSSTSPKPVIKIWAQTRDDRGGTVDPANPCLIATPNWGVEQPNILFNCAYKGIDIELGGNPGAIGLRFSGSQGCYLMDAKVYAKNAHAGFNNCPGQGGGTYNIEVEGGEYGLKIENLYRFPLLAGCKFTGQTKACVYNQYSDLAWVFTGSYFEPATTGMAFDLLNAYRTYGGLCLVDCAAKISQNAVFAKTKTTGENIILENTYLKGFNKFSTVDATAIDPSKWTLVKEYSYCKEGSLNMINGNTSTSTVFNSEDSSEPEILAIQRKHWTPVPAFDEPGVVNVRDYGAKGDNLTIDTDAFKAALAAGDKVFVPKGTYIVNEALTLGPNQHIFGNPKIYTEIKNSIATADDVNATSSISFLKPSSIFWKAGKGAYVFCEGSLSFSGNGGGRFYGMPKMKTIGGNIAPLSIYSYNVERGNTNPMSEIKNAKNINIYYFKVEAGTVSSGTGKDFNTPVKIIDSENIRLYSVTGVTKTIEDRPIVDVVNSQNVMVALVKSLDTSTSSAPAINETVGSEKTLFERNKALCMFIRNQPTAFSILNDNNVKIYPNPISNQFSIDTNGKYEKIEIFSNLGVKLFEKEIKDNTKQTYDNLDFLPAGIHFLNLIGKNEKQVIKIMKW